MLCTFGVPVTLLAQRNGNLFFLVAMVCKRCGYDHQVLEAFGPRYCIKCGERLEPESLKTFETLTVDEVADLLRLTKGSIYQYVRRGIIPAYKVGRSLRFDKAKIENIRGRKEK